MCVAIPGRIVSIGQGVGPSRPSLVAYGDSELREIDLALLPDATVGDYVLVHSGFAIRRVSERDARESRALFGIPPSLS